MAVKSKPVISADSIFSIETIGEFCNRFRATCKIDLGIDERWLEALIEQMRYELCNGRDGAWDQIDKLYGFQVVREKWNRSFVEKRAPVLSNWISPHVRGPLLDLLCGDGAVGEYLADKGHVVLLSEREGAYSTPRELHRVKYINFENLEEEIEKNRIETMLLSTVLHHEDDPDALINFARRAPATRIILVENIIDHANSLAFHAIVDLFFNLCLNKTELHSPFNHRTPFGWIKPISEFSELAFFDKRDTIPAIPLPHGLMIFDKL